MSKEFSFVSQSANHQAQHLKVFVHGYLSGRSADERTKMMAALPTLGDKDEAIFAFWDAGQVSSLLLTALKEGLQAKPNNKLAYVGMAVKGLLSGIQHFNEHKNKTTLLASEFINGLNYFIKNYPQAQSISLYGHSLGARLLIEALLNNSAASLIPIENLVFMGGARELKMHEVASLIALIEGDIYNFYSRSDKVLLAKPSREKSIGRYPIQTSQNTNRVHNNRLELGHTDYWKKLELVLERVEENANSQYQCH